MLLSITYSKLNFIKILKLKNVTFNLLLTLVRYMNLSKKPAFNPARAAQHFIIFQIEYFLTL